jgi:hypothetical protein
MPINPVKLILLAIAGVWMAAAIGCTSNNDMTPPKLIPVKGKVTYKGKPLSKGVVRFSADGYGRDAGGHLKEDGTYELTTLKAGDGVTAGEHRVFITEVDSGFAKDKVMKKYASPVASKLVAVVSPEHNEFNFDLP